jgi:hypothetical protein
MKKSVVSLLTAAVLMAWIAGCNESPRPAPPPKEGNPKDVPSPVTPPKDAPPKDR